jgi:hypothetical protein
LRTGNPVDVLSYSAKSSGSPERAWALMARPALWSQWAPHLRGAWGLGSPEVEQGARGAARLLGVVPVPARIVEVSAPRSWTWRVGPVTLNHRTYPDQDGGSVVAVDLIAPAPIEAALSVTYGPVVQLLVKNLARVAATSAERP